MNVELWREDGAAAEGWFSLLIPLSISSAEHRGSSSLVIYASERAPLRELASHLSSVFAIALETFPFGQSSGDPSPSQAPPSTLTWTVFGVIAQAEGVLMADGFGRDLARTELRRRANAADISLAEAAEIIIAAYGPGPGPHLVPPL